MFVLVTSRCGENHFGWCESHCRCGARLWYQTGLSLPKRPRALRSSWTAAGGSCVPSSSPSYGCSIEVQQASGRWEWRLTYQDTARTKMGDLDLLERTKPKQKKSAKLHGVLVVLPDLFEGEWFSLKIGSDADVLQLGSWNLVKSCAV